VHTAVFAVVATGNLRTVYLVKRSNVRIHGDGGGDIGAHPLWMLGLTTVEVDRFVKVRRDSRKRKSAEREVSGFWMLVYETAPYQVSALAPRL
jgi:hypothetical protein